MTPDLCAHAQPTKRWRARLAQLLTGVTTNDLVAIHWPQSAYDDDGLSDLFAAIHDRQARVVMIIHEQPTGASDFLAQIDGCLCSTKAQAEQLGLRGVPAAFYGPGTYSGSYFKARRKRGRGIDVYNMPEVLPTEAQLSALAQQQPVHVVTVDDQTNVPASTVHPWSRVAGYSAEAVMQLLPGSFGLIWAPDAVAFPLALASQLAANQPLIVPVNSAFASFVADNELGLVVSDFTALADQIAAVDDAQYKHMAMQCERISGLLRSGYYAQRAWLSLQGAML
jgi:hypothetical protein